MRKAIDLFCGAGGSSVGLKQAGFDVEGIDIKEQAEYPFKFYCFDIFDEWRFYNINPHRFDFIWASPPCQAYSMASQPAKAKGKRYPDLIGKTRELLLKTGKPFVLENVRQAPIRHDLVLDGTMFDLGVIRKRAFEVHGFEVSLILGKKRAGTIMDGSYISVVGRGAGSIRQSYRAYMDKNGLKTIRDAYQHAMKIDWITDLKMLAEAVPPAYAKYIGEQFLRQI
ncbi:MAG: DNA cytosine methyltransferase [candidate division Zixibacteria bacterium]|nr:DNA cytosine methyltransferase [candidate division Zixibacteria bacterium]